MRLALLGGAGALSAPLWTREWAPLTGAFLLFEVCCGLYFPSAGTLRGKVIPERSRSAVMNLFRLPLNALVVAVLLNVDAISKQTLFAILVSWLIAAFCCHHVLIQIAKHEEALQTKGADQ